MVRRVRARLFLLSSAVLVVIGVFGVVLARDRLGADELAPVLAATVAVAVGTGALLAWLAALQVREDLRALVTTARRTSGDPTTRPAPDHDELGDLVHDMAADAKRTHAALGRERALLASVLECLSHGVIGFDRRERIVVMNEPARAMLGLAATPIGEVLIDVVRAPALIDLVRAPASDPVELQLRPDLRVLARIAAPRESEIRIAILEDVTAVRRLETVRRDFVANVSHELRTPVAIIRANAETLQRGAKDDPEVATRLLEGLHRNAERLARMLADLLDLSRLDAGQFRFDATGVSVRAAAEGALGALQPRAAERQVAIELEVEPGVVARADAKALDQVLVNLVDNAVKYSDVGGTVWVRAQAADRVRIEVSDDGPGIAPKHRERIFERFYRADAGRARETGGSGLGLAIVKHLVESMGGAVGVEPNQPRGTRFWVELPPVDAPGAR